MRINELETKLSQAKNSRENLDNLMIEYMPFIHKIVMDTAGKRHMEDYMTCALEGFAKAVVEYDLSKGNFISFAAVVMRNQVIDQLRKEGKRQKEVAFYEEYHGVTSDWDVNVARRMEIEMLSQELKFFKITLDRLSVQHPVHKTTREKCKVAAKVITEDRKLMEYLKEKKKLPVQELSRLTGFSGKVFERSREYIIALALIGQEKYGYINEFLKGD
ncbi:MAG: sigma factor [Clostridia bacterium]